MYRSNIELRALSCGQAALFGPVASAPTAWRALQELTARRWDKVAAARATARRRIWELIAARHGGIPASRTCYGDLGEWMVIRLDATIQVCHSDKESAAGTFKGDLRDVPADGLAGQHRRMPGGQTPSGQRRMPAPT
ncbi:hypothetical protein ITP53_28680 [Nonomuraea sp. K274]|uniref:Uncharacterized protein n=1 Tax=Nonomuraea cypriaca TaxID=1187855 RepID=A0A931AEJ4_9ACTN|nr:hypothetical protein [Nonomuraea cypriaca]MBF8189639.1 hypothetical protein [Nonomuraea cypriaca]